MRLIHFLFVLFFLISSCRSKELERASYFNIDSLLTKQISELSDKQALLTKVSTVNDTEDISTFSPDSAGWSNEFAVFRYLDIINKSFLDGAYQEQADAKDFKSNLKVRTLKAVTEIPVKEFVIYHQDGLQPIRKIEAIVEEKNSLFFSSRKLSLEFDNYKNEMLISKYVVSGIQKMMLSDTVHYSIHATVTIK